MIPLGNLARQHAALKPQLDEAIARVFASSQFVLGEEVAKFENEFAAASGAKYAVAMNSGTTALHLALLAAGVGPGDEVITAPFTFQASASSIDYCGARPVFADILPGCFTLNPELAERAITPRTKAIMPVHLYGQAAEIDAFLELAKRRGVAIIFDAAQAHAAQYRGQSIGGAGDISCYSFYPTKNLGAAGEGGAALTNNEDLARRMRQLRDWGQDGKYRHVIKGFNARMEGLQGAILRVKLPHLEAWTEQRRTNARRYREVLEGAELVLPAERPECRHSYHQYTVRATERDGLQQALRKLGVETSVHYPYPLHLLPAWSALGYKGGDFPEAERAAREVLSLPVYPELTRDELEQACAAVQEALSTARLAC